jgi:hypothetical protein
MFSMDYYILSTYKKCEKILRLCNPLSGYDKKFNYCECKNEKRNIFIINKNKIKKLLRLNL